MYSVTSNEPKLFKHLDRLKDIQLGTATPILFHISPTNKCNANCMHCCFADRERDNELDKNDLCVAIWIMKYIGVKSIELTGGGEPSLYTYINWLIEEIWFADLALGMNTNALDITTITKDNWKKFDWVRVSMNAFDGPNKDKFKKNVKTLKKLTKITACYIIPQQIGVKNLKEVIDFADKNKIVTRIAPDCLQTKEKIIELTEKCRKIIDKHPSKYVFLSDFNLYFEKRNDDVCMIHMIKPFLYTDGWVYACPSSELAVENPRGMHKKFRVCRMEDIYRYYRENFDVNHFPCSYCKYARQNNLLYALIQETDHNDFC